MSTITIAGEALELAPGRAIFWPGKRTLLVADPHFGKAAAFRASGVYVPKGTTLSALARLDALIQRHDPTRVIFLGDFLHAKEGRNPDTLAEIAGWRATHPERDMILVRGNHDRRAGDPPDVVGVRCVDAPLLDAPFAFAHHPVPIPGAYVLAGHLHPCAVIFGRGRQRERLPCFWLGAGVGVLPAFGEFTGLAEIEPLEDDSVWVVADDDVIEVRASAAAARGTSP